MTRRAFMLGSVGWLAAACGGGQPAQACAAPSLVAVYGDSTSTGSYSATPGATERSYHASRPVARMVAGLDGCRGIDRSIPGWGVGQHRQGWASTMAMDPASTIVLRLGGADALDGTDPAWFERELATMTRTALAHGKRVVLVGVVHLVRIPEWQPDLTDAAFIAKASRGDELDDAVRRVALLTGCPFVDIRAVPFAGAADIADSVHPAQAYADRCADAIAAVLRHELGAQA